MSFRAFTAIIKRDVKMAMRSFGDGLTLVLFFIMIGVIIPFAVGPNKVLLATIAPGVVWMAAFLSSLLAIDRFFRADFEDGSLLAMRHASISLSTIAFAKLIALWLTTILPLIFATPMLAMMLNMDYELFFRTILSLLVGTPALIAFGGIGAAITVSLKRGGLIAPVLILPLSIPILIFGISAIKTNAGVGVENTAVLFLLGISMLAMVFAPFAIALALKLDQE